MVESGLSFLLYVLVKYVAYVAWCYVGLRWMRKIALRSALGLGLLRLLLGVFFGVGVFVVGGILHLNAPTHPWLTYFMVYAPIRWIEWSITSLLSSPADSSFQTFLRGHNERDRLWRLGGIVISHLADIPLILLGSHGPIEMLPVGRFLC
jgi:hypothetical protein